jgi:hypothetical protein
MVKKTAKANRVAFLTSAACRLIKNQRSVRSKITASDFINFWVSDSAEPCCACDVNPPRCPAPIGIRGQHYCLWCAIEIARELLGGK